MLKFLAAFSGLYDMIPDGTYFVPPPEDTGSAPMDTGDKPSHVSDGTVYDSSKFNDVTDPLAAATADVTRVAVETPDALDPTKPAVPPAKPAVPAKPAEPGKPADPKAPTKQVADLIDGKGVRYGEDGFNQDDLPAEDYALWVHSLDHDATMAELDRVVKTTGDDVVLAKPKIDSKYADLAKKYQKELQDRTIKKDPVKPTQEPASPAAPVRLTMEELAKELNMEIKTFGELPENIRQAFQSAMEKKHADLSKTKQEAELVKVSLKEREEKLEHLTKEAKSAFTKRDAYKQQLQQRNKEIFAEAAKGVGVPADLVELAYDSAKFLDKNKKSIPLRQVFANLKQSHPSLFREAEPPKPKPGATGGGTGSAPPAVTDVPETPINYKDVKGDPLMAAASAFTKSMKQENLSR